MSGLYCNLLPGLLPRGGEAIPVAEQVPNWEPASPLPGQQFKNWLWGVRTPHTGLGSLEPQIPLSATHDAPSPGCSARDPGVYSWHLWVQHA